MKFELTLEMVYELISACDWEHKAKSEYQDYPSYEFRQEQIAEVEARRWKYRKIRDEMKAEAKEATV